MNSILLKQLVGRLKLAIGEPVDSNSNYKYLILLIIIFMTTFDSISGYKINSFTYFHLLDLFLEHKDLIYLSQTEYLQYLKNVGWETDYAVYSFSILQDLRTLIETGEVTSNNFAWFDQNASGPSIVAVLSNSEKLAALCNMTTVTGINMDYSSLPRNCIYTSFLDYCNDNIPNLGGAEFRDFSFNRKWAKYTLMTHFYSAGALTASRLVIDWVETQTTLGKIPPEDIVKYNDFYSSNSKSVKLIRKALLSFCPLGTALNVYFRKIALIFTCDEKKFAKLKLYERKIIVAFRGQLASAGLPQESCDSFFGLGFSTLCIVTPFGTMFEYSSAGKNAGLTHEYSNFNKDSKSAFSHFQLGKFTGVDYNQLCNSFLVNFIHACDASVLQKLSEWFFINHPNDTLATVQDCFGSSYKLTNVLAMQIKVCYYELGFDDHVNLIERCILAPNTERYADKLISRYVYEALKLEYAAAFPAEGNILLNHRESILNSCYWYPFAD